MATFLEDQYFTLPVSAIKANPSELFVAASRQTDVFFERTQIPTEQVKGDVGRINVDTFESLEAEFNKNFRPVLEEKTGLDGLKLQAVRVNTLMPGGSVATHADPASYVLAMFTMSDNFSGGEFYFTKDSGEAGLFNAEYLTNVFLIPLS